MIEFANSLPTWIHTVSSAVLLSWVVLWAFFYAVAQGVKRRGESKGRRLPIGWVVLVGLSLPVHGVFVAYGLAVLSGRVSAYNDVSFRSEFPICHEGVALVCTVLALHHVLRRR